MDHYDKNLELPVLPGHIPLEILECSVLTLLILLPDTGS